MLINILNNVAEQLTPHLVVELILTFFMVYIVIKIFNSDLMMDRGKPIDVDEEKRKRTLESLRKSTERIQNERKLKSKLQGRGRK